MLAVEHGRDVLQRVGGPRAAGRGRRCRRTRPGRSAPARSRRRRPRSSTPWRTLRCRASQSIQRVEASASAAPGPAGRPSRTPGSLQRLAEHPQRRQRQARPDDRPDDVALAQRRASASSSESTASAAGRSAVAPERGRVDRADARAAEDHRPLAALLQDGQQDRQRADLVGAARAAARQHERDPRPRRAAPLLLRTSARA